MKFQQHNIGIYHYLFMVIYLLVVSTVYPMNMITTLRLSLQKQASDSEIVTSFVREFPLMTLKNAQYRYNKCSDFAKKEIFETFYKEENKQISAIFACATQYPQETRTHITRYLFKDNEKATDKFLGLRIIDFYNLYQWSHDVYEGKAGIPSTFNIQSINHIFQLSEEIAKAEAIILKHRNNDLHLGKEDIKTLRIIMNNGRSQENVFIGEQFKYLFHCKYTMNDCISCSVPTAAISACIYVPLTMALLSRLIESYCCTPLMRDSALPDKIKQLTELIYQNGNLSLLDALRQPKDNIVYSGLDLFKKNIPFLITIPGIGFLSSLPQLNSKDFLLFSGTWGTLFSVFCYLCSWISFERLPGSFLGLYITIPTILFIGMNIINVKNGRFSWQSKVIDWNTIDQELQRTEIVIPKESKI